jgi:hypothetical protein
MTAHQHPFSPYESEQPNSKAAVARDFAFNRGRRRAISGKQAADINRALKSGDVASTQDLYFEAILSWNKIDMLVCVHHFPSRVGHYRQANYKAQALDPLANSATNWGNGWQDPIVPKPTFWGILVFWRKGIPASQKEREVHEREYAKVHEGVRKFAISRLCCTPRK